MPKYKLSEIYRAIQGEGYWTGWPCTLVRFQGCNLRCSFCDTVYAQEQAAGELLDLDSLIDRIARVHRQHDMVLLTGGEPTIQPLPPLIKALSWLGPVHLETNGTLPVPVKLDWVVVSPKGRVVEEAVKRANEVKWLVNSWQDVNALTDFLDEWSFSGIVSVQPLSLSESATEVAYSAAMSNGWHLSLQTHKLIDMR